jgi:hypothetical protein
MSEGLDIVNISVPCGLFIAGAAVTLLCNPLSVGSLDRIHETTFGLPEPEKDKSRSAEI